MAANKAPNLTAAEVEAIVRQAVAGAVAAGAGSGADAAATSAQTSTGDVQDRLRSIQTSVENQADVDSTEMMKLAAGSGSGSLNTLLVGHVGALLRYSELAVKDAVNVAQRISNNGATADKVGDDRLWNIDETNAMAAVMAVSITRALTDAGMIKK